MAEQTFRSPGFFEREIDLSQRQGTPSGTPAGIIGTAEKGPAFVPVTVGSMLDFKAKFGDMDSKKFGPYAVNEFFNQRQSNAAVTYVRVLGAGANETASDISTTNSEGTVKNAGFKITPVSTDEGPIGHESVVQFLVAQHDIVANETRGYPIFSDNASIGDANATNLVRAVLFTSKDARFGVFDHNESGSDVDATFDDDATIGTAGVMNNKFKLFISSSDLTFGGDDGKSGIKIYTASLDPANQDYIRNVLNTDPAKFGEKKHLLYAAYDVEASIGVVKTATSNVVAILSGSSSVSSNNSSSEAHRIAFGRFDTRFTTPQTTKFISQPFGDKEFDLFHFETISDGAYGNDKFKISIANLKASTNPKNEYGSFTMHVRRFDDTDASQEIIESFPNCNLNLSSPNYVAKKVGDMKAFYNFDAPSDDDRHVATSGRYPNRSQFVRIIMHDNVSAGRVPANALPFGFRGLPVLKTNPNMNDGISGSDTAVLVGRISSGITALSGSIIPPVPFRFKVTNGNVATTGAVGAPGSSESVGTKYYWGIKNTKVKTILNSNSSDGINAGLKDMLKFSGISKMDVLVSGDDADTLNENKFTLARVAFGNQAGGTDTGVFADNEMSGTVKAHMLEAAYLRNGIPDSSQYTVSAAGDSMLNRITFATLASHKTKTTFNRFSNYMKFTNVFYGGFDGINILDSDSSKLNDKASSVDGGAKSDYVPLGFTVNQSGVGNDNAIIASYKSAINIMTDPFAVRTNLLAIPGIREPKITDHTSERNNDYGMAFFIMDIPGYDDGIPSRLFDDSTVKPDVRKTAEQFNGRAIDDNMAATYFPDVVMDDPNTGQKITMPSSIAALSAIALTDRTAHPWFAPAGFKRGALDSVKNVDVRLNAEDRNVLQDYRINPIATFPNNGYAIFGQKTMQQAKSALDRVNVRRLMLDIKRIVGDVAIKMVFEQNTSALRKSFIAQVTPLLALIQMNSGIEKFSIVMDESNNTSEDIEANKLNGKIIVVPTRAIEFVSLDFIITNSGVSFE